MEKTFKFLDKNLNQELVDLLERAKINHSIDKDGTIRYSADDDEAVENDLICTIRDRIIPSWQVLTCPSDWTGRYRDYMSRRGIPFREELSDGELWFLIPRKLRPHSWKLDGRTKKGSLKPQRSN